MLISFASQKYIHVFETTLTIQHNTLSVFNIIIQGPHSTVSLIRYPFDLLEFHQKIQLYYPKTKISFPSLTNPSRKSTLRYLKRRSFRDLLPFPRKKSNADKVEKYLERCFQHSIISISSILRDFTRVQREEDSFLNFQQTSPILAPTNDTIPPTVIGNIMMSTPSIIPLSTPPQPTLITRNSTSTELTVMLTKPSSKDYNSPPTQPKLTLDDFELLKILGKGCMGKVVLVRSKINNQLYALKSIKKKWVLQQKEMIHTKTERDILVNLRHQPFLVNLYCVFQTPSELFLVLDYCAGGDIASQLSLLSNFTEERTKFYAAEIVQGLEILHQNNIVYRDLKPENVLVGLDGHIILTDFGLSKIFTADDIGEYDVPCTQTFCGTAEYLAPEVLLGEPYTFVVDFWSLGTLVYEMLAGITPFWADTHMDMYKRVLEDSLQFPCHFDETTKSFLAGLLEKEACERLGWGENGIEYIKRHPYFDDIDWDEVKQRKLRPPHIPTIRSETDISNFDDMFTSMPVHISQSSAVSVDSLGEDPFKGFSYYSADYFKNSLPSTNSSISPNNETHICIAGTSASQNQLNTRIRKRHSTTLSLTPSIGPLDKQYHLSEESRAIKKRQMMNSPTHSLIRQTPSITSTIINPNFQESDTERSLSIYSHSSLTFANTMYTTNVAEEEAETDSAHEMPSPADTLQQGCIFLQQPMSPSNRLLGSSAESLTRQASISSSIHNIAHSNASTINNSLCSYLTLSHSEELIHAAQNNYFSQLTSVPPSHNTNNTSC
ncbi:MAG: kinase-like domain-containing protein [Benjaminiella poitrasii]|nr:MAG: kinase-like domain-containing protein [Benjaminiella poitrasii]